MSAALGAAIALLFVVFRGAAGADGSGEAAESAGTLAIAGDDIGIWILIVSVTFLVYGAAFWLVNFFLFGKRR